MVITSYTRYHTIIQAFIRLTDTYTIYPEANYVEMFRVPIIVIYIDFRCMVKQNTEICRKYFKIQSNETTIICLIWAPSNSLDTGLYNGLLCVPNLSQSIHDCRILMYMVDAYKSFMHESLIRNHKLNVCIFPQRTCVVLQL